MYTLDNFIIDTQAITKFRLEEDRRYEAFHVLFPDGVNFNENGEVLFDSYVKLLSEKYNDDEEWIPYFIWECELGKKDMDVKINDVKVELKTWEDVYKLVEGTL